MKYPIGLVAALLGSVVGVGSASGGAEFRVKFDRSVRGEPASGRLIVMLVKGDSGITQDPVDGPFWGRGQPMYGVDVSGLAPGSWATVGDGATAMGDMPSKLPPGAYRAQAYLDRVRADSEWKREDGNLYSGVVAFTVEAGKPDASVEIVLDRAINLKKEPVAWPAGVELFELRSKLLSDFRGTDVVLRAGVVLPKGRDASRAYPAVYEVPGFGGTHTGAIGSARGFDRAPAGSAEATLHENAFWIVLDPESPNGHTLFADSANNGPCGRALVEELIPALEKKYNLVTNLNGRLLRGHSSGGWSTIWLAITYPGTFSAAWSSSPDPVDFRRFQAVDIYGQPNMYTMEGRPDASPGEAPSTRSGGHATMAIREENAVEEVLGPHNSSGQQWDSWMAVFGPRDADGHVAALYDPKTGVIDHAVAEKYRAYDVGELVRRKVGNVPFVLNQRVRLIVGDEDTFYLNEAVALIKPEVDALAFPDHKGRGGYVKIVPGKDHGSIFNTPEMKAIPGEMVEHLRVMKMLGEKK